MSPVCWQKRTRVLPAHTEEQCWLTASVVASQGSGGATVRLWNIRANPSIGEDKNEPVSAKRAVMLYVIMIYKGNLPGHFTV